MYIFYKTNTKFDFTWLRPRCTEAVSEMYMILPSGATTKMKPSSVFEKCGGKKYFLKRCIENQCCCFPTTIISTWGIRAMKRKKDFAELKRKRPLPNVYGQQERKDRYVTEKSAAHFRSKWAPLVVSFTLLKPLH